MIAPLAVLLLASVTVRTDVREVEVGRGFPLVVTRTWTKGEPPGALPGENRLPFTLRAGETNRYEARGVVTEERHYVAFAFATGEFTLPPELTGGEAIVVAVHGTLDPDDPGPPELPSGPLGGSGPGVWLYLFVGAIVAAGALLVAYRRRNGAPAAPEPAPEEPPPPTAAATALSRLAVLGIRYPSNRAEIRAWHDEAARILRDYLAERFGLPAAEMTTEECVAARAVPVPARPRLASALAPTDLVKFAGHESSREERAEVVARSEAFLREAEA